MFLWMTVLYFRAFPRESFKVIFNLAGYFHFARLFLETLRKDLLKQAQMDFSRAILPCKVIFALQGKRLKITREDA